MKNIWNVDFVYADEATPREGHVKTVEAPDAETAKSLFVVAATLRGDGVIVGTVWR